MFRAGPPVTATGFHNREGEIKAVLAAIAALEEGAPKWLALIGPRKIGKTSLLFEAARRSSRVGVAMVDAMEQAPLTLELFRSIALYSADVLLAESTGSSLSRLRRKPSEYRALLRRSTVVQDLSLNVRDELERLVEDRADGEAVARWLSLPETLATELDSRLVVAIDEVQELATLTSKAFDPFRVMRSVWQHHQRVAYVLSGSAPSTIRKLVTVRHSPFFQHFDVLDIGPFARDDAIGLLTEESPPGRRITKRLASRIVDLIGGNPFYLQIVGEALVATDPPYDEGSLKPLLQGLLFSRVGRLGLYFQNEYQRSVGRASTLAVTLEAVAELEPARLTDVAHRIAASTASTARYLERLGDVIHKDEQGCYSVSDALFRLWLRWRAPGGTTVPMTVIGDEAEIAVAGTLSRLGFDLVYQSRGSRGAFDLLAIRGPDQLGIQVKRSPLPLRFTKAEWSRMQADAERWGWKWAVAAVHDNEVMLLDPARATRGRGLRLGEQATIDNLLSWLDR